MKKTVKKIIFLFMSLLLIISMVSCGNDVVKEQGRNIVDYTMNGKSSKISKLFNKDDDDYDANCYLIEDLITEAEDYMECVFDSDYEYSKEKITTSNDEATIEYVLKIEDGEFEYTLDIVKDDDKWIIADNAQYIIRTYALYIEVALEVGDKSVKKEIKEMLEDGDYDDALEAAEDAYYEMLDYYYDSASDDIDDEEDDDSYDVEYIFDDSDYSSIVDMTMFIAYPGYEINDGNDIQEIIAEKTGVRVKETWLTGQTSDAAIASIIASGDLPDFIYVDDMSQLYDADWLVAWDDYLDIYPNIKELYTEEEWDKLRAADGRIYWVPVFNNTYGESMDTTHIEGAFWIQTRVLEWAGYPDIETVDEYFELLESYAKENPTMSDGEDIIPFTTLCDDWRNYCLTNPPLFIGGYANDGSVAVDTSGKNPTVIDYNISDTAKEYYRQLNEAYKNGVLDPDFADQTYDEYIAKLSTGAVLGMYDQYWDFYYSTDYVFEMNDLYDEGCGYVPLALVEEKGMTNQYHDYSDTMTYSGGFAVTKKCENVDLAFEFVNDILDQDIHDLRMWGVKDVDYYVDFDGLYFRDDEQRAQAVDNIYKSSHICSYSYMPQWRGTSRDGMNAMQPSEQTSEFLATLPGTVADCFNAYGVNGYAGMLHSDNTDKGPWFPMYSYSNAMSTDTDGGVAYYKIKDLMSSDLPEVVMAKDFDKAWNNYVADYNKCNPQDFIDEMQEELDRRNN